MPSKAKNGIENKGEIDVDYNYYIEHSIKNELVVHDKLFGEASTDSSNENRKINQNDYGSDYQNNKYNNKNSTSWTNTHIPIPSIPSISPFELIKNLHQKLYEDIAAIAETKKRYSYRLFHSCYEAMNEIEYKTEQEKLSLEQLLNENIQFESFIYNDQLQSINNILKYI